MTTIRRQKLFFKYAAATTAAVAVAALVAGCGGTSGSSGSSSAHVRAVNLIANGGTATVYINSGSANGQQNFDQASGYLYVGGGTSTFTFVLSSVPIASLPITSLQMQLNNGSAYTAFLIGNASILTGGTPGFPQVQVLNDDYPAVPAGQALVRVIDAAPDAASINISVAGEQINSTPLQYAGTQPTGNTVPARSTGYLAVTAGASTVTITNGSTTLVSGTETFQSGHAYSVFLTEPTFTPPTYGILQLDDAH